MRVRRLDRVGVVLGRADAAAVGGAHGDRAVEAAAAAVPHPRELADDLVVRLQAEAGELDLGHAAPARRPRGRPTGADDRRLRDRRVEHAARAEAVEQHRRWRGTRRRWRRCPRRAARPARRVPSRRASVSRIAASMVMLATRRPPVVVGPSSAPVASSHAPSRTLRATISARCAVARARRGGDVVERGRGIDLARERARR